MRPVARHGRPDPGLLLAGVLLAAQLLAAGCATTAPSPVLQAGNGDTTPMELGGRFAMSYNQALPEPKTESANGRFSLFRDATRLTVDLVSPFGQTIARAEHVAGEPARLQTADNRTFTGPTLDEVFRRAIGIRVPAEKLPAWLSNRFERVLERSADGQRIKAEDAGWDIDRSGGRWDLVWHRGTQRIEVRLLLDAQ